MHEVARRTPPRRVTGYIEEIEPIGRDYLDILIAQSYIANGNLPGQFVMIKGWNALEPILLRPFDIVQTGTEADSFHLLIKITGRGTQLLAQLDPGNEISVLGPLGMGITSLNASSIGLLVRGAGAAAVVSLAAKARAEGTKVFTFLSAATESKIVCRDFLEKLSTEFIVVTDDGSAGYHGDARDKIDEFLSRDSLDAVYTCGSRRFAGYVQQQTEAGMFQGYLFLEGYMACGIGDCHGCAVIKKKEEGYFLVCQEGPVFPAADVLIE